MVVNIKFIYFKNVYEELKKENEKIINVLQNYSVKMKEKFENLHFYYKGIKLKLDKELTIKDLNPNGKVTLIVIDLKNKNQKFLETKQIICPICKNIELSLFKLSEDKITLSNCKEKHTIENLDFNQFLETQNLNKDNITCEECLNKISYYNSFYKCSCEKYLCPLCIYKHSKDIQIEYIDLFNKCYKHNLPYVSYCKNCCKNLCTYCEKNCKGNGHKIKILKKYMIDVKKINSMKEKINENKSIISIYMEGLQRLKQRFGKKINDLITFLAHYNKLLEKIKFSIENLNNYENYKILNNYKKFKTSDYINNMKEKIYNILIKQIKYFDKKNKMSMIYENNNLGLAISLLGEVFINNNKNNCALLINDEEKKEYKYKFDQKKKERYIKVELFGDYRIRNLSSMFNNCNSLCSIDTSDWDVSNVTDMNKMFSCCHALKSLTGLNNWDTSNVKDMSSMFFECCNLKCLSDISNWNTKNVKDMNNLFKGCSNLKFIPDISKWETSQVTNMSFLFCGCKSLINLPDISNWNTSNVIDFSSMFSNCELLKNLPDISNWNTSRVKNMKFMFNQCNTLKYLPDISKWDTSQVENFQQIFNNCRSLEEIPNNIHTWKISKTSVISFMFNGCTSLKPRFEDYNQIFENIQKI